MEKNFKNSKQNQPERGKKPFKKTSASKFKGKDAHQGEKPFKKSSFKKDKDARYEKPDQPFKKTARKGFPEKLKKEGRFKKDSGFSKDQFPEKKFEKKDKDFSKKEFKGKKFDRNDTVQRAFKDKEPTPERKKPATAKSIDEPMTLNKYIAHSGECSRRAAADMVKQGKVRVNGELVLDPGYRVAPGDTVSLSGKKLTPQKNLVYVLLNKPKDYITTTDDPQDRKTVMDLVQNADVDRLYPVGRLDRKTTGLLLLTNDGALAHRLSHPSYQIRKVYQVTLDKNLTKADYDKIFKGLELEDGLIQVDEVAYLENRNEIGIEIHSGKNRIVRRIFESLGYEVEKLDRVIYAGLTKKNLPRGKWRFLNEKEIIFLKHFKN